MIWIIIIIIISALVMFSWHDDKYGRYLELTWTYPLPDKTPLKYNYNFTNHPMDCNRSMGNGGRGYECYDLYKEKDIERLKEINKNYKKDNFKHRYLEDEVIEKAIAIYHSRYTDLGRP